MKVFSCIQSRLQSGGRRDVNHHTGGEESSHTPPLPSPRSRVFDLCPLHFVPCLHSSPPSLCCMPLTWFVLLFFNPRDEQFAPARERLVRPLNDEINKWTNEGKRKSRCRFLLSACPSVLLPVTSALHLTLRLRRQPSGHPDFPFCFLFIFIDKTSICPWLPSISPSPFESHLSFSLAPPRLCRFRLNIHSFSHHPPRTLLTFHRPVGAVLERGGGDGSGRGKRASLNGNN